MKLSKDITIKAPAKKIWDILAYKFADAGTWARSISSSTPNHNIPKVNNSPIGGRLCDTSIGKISEEITTYDEGAMTLSFRSVITSAVFDNVVSTNAVTAINENTSKVTITHNVDLKTLGFFTLSLVRFGLNKAMNDVLADLKYFAENDKPSRQKIASKR